MRGNIEDISVPDKSIEGDINADGEFNVSDAVILQKWLLNVSDYAPDD
ncbi:MAG: hypothetical protein IKK91_07960 [Ruminococcus sp.]|nr:hypothetical protein [Ruminococcus sp.]